MNSFWFFFLFDRIRMNKKRKYWLFWYLKLSFRNLTQTIPYHLQSTHTIGINCMADLISFNDCVYFCGCHMSLNGMRPNVLFMEFIMRKNVCQKFKYPLANIVSVKFCHCIKISNSNHSFVIFFHISFVIFN